MPELMTKQQIAKELLKPYFDNPSLCSMGSSGRCLYSGPKGRMCVFARACTPEGRKRLDECLGAHGNLEKLGYGILKEQYRHIKDVGFWVYLQAAHDALAEGRDDFAQAQYEKLTGEKYTRV